MLKGEEQDRFIQHQKASDTPLLRSEDGRCTLRIVGWLNTVEWVQVYWFEAEPGGVLESEAHQDGSIENLSVIDGELEIQVDGESRTCKQGETIRYRADCDHSIVNTGSSKATAIMVNILKSTVMT